MCCSPWGRKELDTTERLNRTELIIIYRTNSTILFFWAPNIDGNCSHEIKRYFLLGRKAMTNLDSILKSKDIPLSTKVCLVKAMVFPVVMYGCESWSVKKAEC